MDDSENPDVSSGIADIIDNVESVTAIRPSISEKRFVYKLIHFVILYWKTFVIILWPCIIVPVVIVNDSKQARCALVVMLMGMYLVTESLPMAITSLLPLVLFPTLGILSSSETCGCYINDTIMVFIGGYTMAIAIEHCNLHMRIALGVMKIVGCSHRKLLAGILIVTTLLGMWISNTACTAMMVPIIFAVLFELEKAGLTKVFVNEDAEDPLEEKIPTKITKGYLMATAYSATFGGTTTLVGTGTNLTFKGIFETTFPESEGISFTTWMFFGTPQALIQIGLTYVYFLICYMGMFRPNSKDAQEARIGIEGERIANKVVQEKYHKLGKITFHEAAVSSLFVLCVILWFFRKPGFLPGWGNLLEKNDIKDSAPVIMIIILMFIIPKEPSFLHYFDADASKTPSATSEGLITWKLIETKMPWRLMFLLGSGFAISKGTDVSCLANKIGEILTPLQNSPPLLILAVILFFISCITEFTTNIGIANIILPIIAQLSMAIHINPLYLMVPSTLVCSYAFRLPVGTPPNAIITVAGNIPIKSLVVGGCGPTIYSYIVVMILFPTFGTFVYGINGFPDWANPKLNLQNFKC